MMALLRWAANGAVAAENRRLRRRLKAARTRREALKLERDQLIRVVGRDAARVSAEAAVHRRNVRAARGPE